MKTRKILAFGMATMLTLSSTVMAFAADETTDPASGSVNGSGSLEGYVDKEVFTVTLPTTTDVDFKLDPQELLLATSSSANLDSAALAAGYGDKVLFVDGSDYLSKSKDITIINKSTFDVDVEVNAKLSGLTKEGEDGYAIQVMDASADDFDFGTDTAITMALTPSTNTITGAAEGTAVAGTATYLTDDAAGVTVKSTVAKSADVDDAYEVTGTTGNYSYAIKADVSAVPFNEAVFNLSGTVNTAADWTNFSKDSAAALNVAVTYTVTKHVDGPQVSMDASGKITVSNLTADKNVTGYAGVVLKKADGESYALRNSSCVWDGSNWDATNGGTAVYQLNSVWASWSGETVTVTVTLSDGSTITTTGTFTVQ